MVTRSNRPNKSDKNILASSIVALAAFTLLGSDAFAASPAHDDHGFPWAVWVVNLINLAIFVGIIYYFAGSKISAFFANRSDSIDRERSEARRLREEAQQRLDEYDLRLTSFEREREELLEEYKAQGERERERLIEEARGQIEKMRVDARRTIEQETRKAVAALERQAVDMAVEMAQRMARERLDDNQQRVLVDRFVVDLAEADASQAVS